MNQTNSLEKYHAKRNFSVSPEPKGKVRKKKDQLIFTVQKHAARRLHYDFRLELNGVLKSWAVPKGPSINPNVKRLAVETEDHPIDYAEFEGTIPEGQYGGGTVLVWDIGKWHPLDEDPDKALKEGKLSFELDGQKLRGRWNLIRLKKKGEWLLIKDKSDTQNTYDVVKEKPESVISGRDIRDISRPEASLPVGAVSAPFPHDFSPQLATLTEKPPTSQSWLHEIKLDGYRLTALIENKKIRLITRNGKDWTKKFPDVVEELRRLKVDNIILDGEIVAINDHGVSDFQRLQNTLHSDKPDSVYYYLFDVPFFNGYSLEACALKDRKSTLKRIIGDGSNFSHLRYSRHLKGQGQKVFEQSCELGAEGIISKKEDSSYRSGRSVTWVKSKCIKRQEFIIIGFTESPSQSRPFGALHLAYNQGRKLKYAGKVGTGFSKETFNQLMPKFASLAQPSPEIPVETVEKSNWLKPLLAAEVTYTEWTKDEFLRHPSFIALREDKDPSDIVKENPSQIETGSEVAGVELSHPERILYPEQGVTKYQLVKYYENVAPYILPDLRGRLLSLLRCPSGSQKNCFFQKHQQNLPVEGLQVHQIKQKDGDKRSYLSIKNIKGLINLVQNGVLEFHTWPSQTDNLDSPDTMIFDLDPGSGTTWNDVKDAAFHLQEQLKHFKMESAIRTTGGKGLHVCVPLRRIASFDTVGEWAKDFAVYMTTQGDYTATMSKEKRRGKIFIDHFRNKLFSTSICSLSTRAREGAPVSMPLKWQDLSSIDDPLEFTIVSAPTLVSKWKNHPWSEIMANKSSISRKKIEALNKLS